MHATSDADRIPIAAPFADPQLVYASSILLYGHSVGLPPLVMRTSMDRIGLLWEIVSAKRCTLINDTLVRVVAEARTSRRLPAFIFNPILNKGLPPLSASLPNRRARNPTPVALKACGELYCAVDVKLS